MFVDVNGGVAHRLALAENYASGEYLNKKFINRVEIVCYSVNAETHSIVVPKVALPSYALFRRIDFGEGKTGKNGEYDYWKRPMARISEEKKSLVRTEQNLPVRSIADFSQTAECCYLESVGERKTGKEKKEGAKDESWLSGSAEAEEDDFPRRSPLWGDRSESETVLAGHAVSVHWPYRLPGRNSGWNDGG